MKIKFNKNVHERVKGGYGKIALEKGSCCASSSCCSGGGGSIARAAGYSEKELSQIPDGADMGLSCGNPIAMASLKEGETVLDLGSGGGFDLFMAARWVGPAGRVIGVDMTPEMVSLAKKNCESFRKSTGLNNIEIHQGLIEEIPLPDSSVDVVISNCVINLSPDKERVWREIFRVLKPGGRVSISDLALLRPLPVSVRESVEALIGCVGGAVLVDEYRSMAEAAGFTEIIFETKSDYTEKMMEWSDPLYREVVEKLPKDSSPADYITSLLIRGLKSA